MKLLHLQNNLSGVLSPLGTAYAALMAVRRKLWEDDLFHRFAPSCPCVSVGNICWGGTGKTPLVDWLMGRALERGGRPVVLTRGYKSSPTVLPLHVNAAHSPAEAGDEPLMLALRHPDAAVLVDPNRRRAAKEALLTLEPTLFILDDGMQHLAIRRHLELVVLRPQDLGDQWGRVIPQGSWREGLEALRRADAFFLKVDAENFHNLFPLLKDRLLELGKPVFSFELRPTSLVRLDGSDKSMPRDFGGRPYALVTGVGNPVQVRDTTARFMGYEPEEHFAFSDHHEFTFKDVRRLEACGLPVLCTTKDAVKLRRMPMAQLWCIHTEVVFGPSLWSRLPFPQWWDGWMENAVQVLEGPATSVVPRPEGFDPDAALDMDFVPNHIKLRKAGNPDQSAASQPGHATLPAAQQPTSQTSAQPAGSPPQPLRFATPPRPGKGLPASPPAGKSRTWDNDTPRPARPTTPGLPGGRKPS